MKKPLYFAIRKNLYDDIVAVTSEHPSGKWAGRYVKDNTVTHGSNRYGQDDKSGSFETQEQAEAMRDCIRKIGATFKERREALNRQFSELYKEERAAIDAAIEGAGCNA